MQVAVGIVVFALVVVWLVITFSELFRALFKSMRASNQKLCEYDHFWKHGYAKRRRQL